MAKEYLNAFMNNSATIRDVLAADITGAPHKAVTYNANGKLALPASDGDAAVGFILSDAPTNDSGVTAAGTEVDVLIKDIGLGEAGAAIAKGAFVTATKDGTVKTAEAGNFILGTAMTAATAAGNLVQVQLTKSGYFPAASKTDNTDDTNKEV